MNYETQTAINAFREEFAYYAAECVSRESFVACASELISEELGAIEAAKIDLDSIAGFYWNQ